MKTEIHRFSLGFANCYLIREERLVLVDAGMPNKGSEFLKELKALPADPKGISLIVVTHAQWDHVGSLCEIKAFIGCQVAANQHEKDWIEQALKRHPPGISSWGKILAAIGKVYGPVVRFPPTTVDWVLEDKEYPLEPYGIAGRVLYTPGHSPSSTSLLLDTGDAFFGDLAMNSLPLRIGPGMPCVGEDAVTIKESWRLLLNMGAKWIHPGHGKPFKADVLERLL